MLSVVLGVVTLTAPVVAPAGTVADISVSERTLKAAATPWNMTLVVPVRLFPRMMTFVPTLPCAGIVCTYGRSPRDKLKNTPLP